MKAENSSSLSSSNLRSLSDVVNEAVVMFGGIVCSCELDGAVVGLGGLIMG